MNRIITFPIIYFFLTTFSNADYLNINSKNICVYNVQPFQGSAGICYTKRSDGSNVCDVSLVYDDLIDGYEYVNSGCYLTNDLQLTGLTQNQWDYFLAVIAHILGFTFLFLINYIAVLTVKSRS